ncbi:ABC transporter transmembrane domain-containing protein, partial [Candidatus Pelagibacter communis]|uniref:ABC transporter transmembrane domain-containing protein n=1 Tax=Pelagibacter ubique TaxID=198252 RepID=UPI00211D0BD1
MRDSKLLKRLYKDYTKKHLSKIFLALLFSLVLAGSTSSIAYLLDPAIEKIFINKDRTLILIIPIFIIFAFAAKGISLYGAKVIMIRISEEIRKNLQMDMMRSLIKADTDFIETRHSGKIITNLINDVNYMTGLVSVAILNIFKDTLTLIGLLAVMFYQNWKLSIV